MKKFFVGLAGLSMVLLAWVLMALMAAGTVVLCTLAVAAVAWLARWSWMLVF